LIGIELVKDRKTKERATQEAEQVLYQCLAQGLSFKLTMGSIITLCPPLIITKKDFDAALDIIERAISMVSEVKNELAPEDSVSLVGVPIY